MISAANSYEIGIVLFVPCVLVEASQREVPHVWPLEPVAEEGEVVRNWRLKSGEEDLLG
jgi:hypothetical protein